MYQNNTAFIFSDPHLRIEDLKFDKNSGEYYLPVLEKIKEKVKKLQPKYIFNLGDTFHNKDRISSTLLILYYKFLKEVTQNSIVVQLVGNHDFSIVKNEHTYHPFKILEMDNLISVDDVYRLNDDIVFMSYAREKELFEKRIHKLGKSKILMAHLDINGFALGDDYIEKHAFLNPEDLKDFQKVFSGHYHEPQGKMVTKNLEIVYIGSPSTTTFGESDQEKRFILLNLDNYTYESIPSDMTFHKTIQVKADEGYPELNDEELKNGIKYRVKISGTKEEIDLMRKPKKYPATISLDIIPTKKTRLKIDKEDTKEVIIDKYTVAELEQRYQGIEQSPFELEKLVELGKKYLKRVKRESVQEKFNYKGNMELLTLKSENMYSFPLFELDFREYEQGTTIILGKNLDMDSANGAGKTSILKILYYTLWGKELENVPFGEVAFFKNKSKGFAVELVFRDGEDVYKIIRSSNCKLDTKLIKMHDGSSPKNSTIEFLINGEPFDVEADSKLLKNIIASKLGMSSNIFLNSVLTAQNRKTNFLDSPDSNKKEDLSEILDLGFYDEAKKLVDKDMDFLEERLLKGKNNLDLLKNSIDQVRNSIESLLESSKNHKQSVKEKIASLKDKNLKLTNEKKSNEDQLNSLKDFNKEEFYLLEKDIQHLKKEISKLEEDTAKEGKLVELKTKEENIIENTSNNIKNLSEKNKDLDLKINEKENIIKDLNKNLIKFSEEDFNNIKIKKGEFENKLKELNRVKSLVEKNQYDLKTNKEKLKEQLKRKEEIELIIKKLEEDNKCDKCLRPFSEKENELQGNLIKKDKEGLSQLLISINSIEEDISSLEKELLSNNELIKNLNSVEKELEKVRKEESEIIVIKEKSKGQKDKLDYINKEIVQIRTEISKNNKLIEDNKQSNLNSKNNLDKIIPYFSKVEEFKKELKEKKILLDSKSKKYNVLSKTNTNFQLLTEKNKNIISELKNLEEQLISLKEEKNPYRKMINNNQEKIKSYKNEIQRVTEKIQEQEEDIKYLKFWKNGFSKNGIKSFETEEVILYLNEKTQDNLNILSEGMQSLLFEPEKTAKTTGTISNNIYTRFFLNGEERPKESLSGGERQRLVLATDLALSDVAETKSNISFNIKFLDEPFDGIDSSGQIKALALFNSLSETRKGFFIISHDKEMQSFCDNAIYILKENGASRIVDRPTFLNASN